MLLRESGERAELGVDMRVVRGHSAEADGGVPNGAALRRFAEDVVRGGEGLAASRGAVLEAVGATQAAHAAGVIASFDAINRVADATGIRLDEQSQARAGDLIEELELETLRSA